MFSEVELSRNWGALCSQHLEHGSNNSYMTFGIQKLVEPEAVSWVKNLMIYGSQHGPGQMYRWRITDESMVDNAARF